MKKHVKYFRFYTIIAIAILFLNCSHQKKEEFLSEISTHNKRYMRIWVHSDMQPRDKAERIHYEKSIRDINRNIKDIYIAIVAGDIVQKRRSSKVYEWFLNLRGQTDIKYWYEIAGNHEAKNLHDYIKYIKKPLHYSVQLGNVMFLFLSDEIDSPPTEISNRAFRWWEEKVVKNQDKIIITVTHGLLKQSELLGTTLSKMIIKNSKRFADVLIKYRVDIWICGHTHLPHYAPGKVMVSHKLNGTLFIDVSAIRKDVFTNIESVIFTFKTDSRNILIQSRNHEEQRYNRGLELLHRLSHRFIWDSSPPVITCTANQ